MAEKVEMWKDAEGKLFPSEKAADASSDAIQILRQGAMKAPVLDMRNAAQYTLLHALLMHGIIQKGPNA